MNICIAAGERRSPVKIAFILFDGMTFLDFAGFYDAVECTKERMS